MKEREKINLIKLPMCKYQTCKSSAFLDMPTHISLFLFFFSLLMSQSQKSCHPDLLPLCLVPLMWSDVSNGCWHTSFQHHCPLISVFYLASWLPPASLCGLILQDLIIIHAVHILLESNLFLCCKKIHFLTTISPQKLHLSLVEAPSLNDVMGVFEVLL